MQQFCVVGLPRNDRTGRRLARSRRGQEESIISLSSPRSQAVELRDGDKKVYMGKGVLKSVAAVNDLVGPKIVGMDPCCQVSHARWWVSSAQRSNVLSLVVFCSRMFLSVSQSQRTPQRTSGLWPHFGLSLIAHYTAFEAAVCRLFLNDAGCGRGATSVFPLFGIIRASSASVQHRSLPFTERN